MQKKHTSTLPKRTTDRDGQTVLLVPVSGPYAPHVKIFPEDYAALLRSGLSPFWNVSSKGHARACLGRESLLIARLLTGADNRHRVVYRDKDRTNLRRDNLALVPYKGLTRKPREPRDIKRHLRVAEQAAA